MRMLSETRKALLQGMSREQLVTQWEVLEEEAQNDWYDGEFEQYRQDLLEELDFVKERIAELDREKAAAKKQSRALIIPVLGTVLALMLARLAIRIWG